jgi:hypothetical protein
MPLEQSLGDAPHFVIRRGVWQLLVLAEDDDARPLPLSCDFVDLDTHQGILSHPLDLLTERGKAIEVLAVEVEMYGNDVGLVVPSASQPTDVGRGQHGAALAIRHFFDHHGKPSRVAEGPAATQEPTIGERSY